MKMTRKKAYDPHRGEYEIEIPATRIVKETLLALDYSQGAIKVEEVARMLTEQFSLSDEQKNAKHKNGFGIFNQHVGGAAGALVNKGQLMRPKPAFINLPGSPPPPPAPEPDLNSDESIEEIYQKLRESLAIELRERINDNPPAFFEKLVLDLLVEMGYGGSREDAEAVGRSGDGGIDRVINEDRLGLDVVYVQAKRWEGNVSRPEIQKFAGALQGQRARKGIFITTSDFTKDARAYVEAIDSKIVLINGDELAQFMIAHNVGVSTIETYEIKRVDSDYFAENAE